MRSGNSGVWSRIRRSSRRLVQWGPALEISPRRRNPAARAAAGRVRGAGLLGAACVLLCLSSPVKGQGFDEFDQPPERAPGRPRFQVDAVSRLGEAGPQVLLAFQVPYRALFFRPVGSRFLSEFELIMTLYRGDQQIGESSGPSATKSRRSRRPEPRP